MPHNEHDDRFSNSLSRLGNSLGGVKDSVQQSSGFGECPTCRKPVLGGQVTAFGRVYHPEHFQCGVCKAVISSNDFYEADNKPLCNNCHKHAGSVICAFCNKGIVGKITTAMGKKFHPGHFQCCVCKVALDTIPYVEQGGKVYCEKDYQENFGSCCVECGKPIEGECMQEGERYWHPEHFKCAFCHKLIESGTYFMVGDKLCCEDDYANETLEVCPKCKSGITGDFLEALGAKWHTNHFVCSYCSKSLMNIEFTEDNGQVYCTACATDLF
jgi:paxillin